ncbi:hypothetical protein [Halosegnis longus]|uniref:hypothetical protein n=1 Tax=Halosegnis longus TaxID=2216012 RepID=UPI00129D55A8|nr:MULTISPECIES: hypothetical protein [Halobacteriales]
MSTTESTTRPGQPTTTTTRDRWTDERRVTTAAAPRTFGYRNQNRLPNRTDETNESVPR